MPETHSSKQYHCVYCQRSNFKSERGLHQHLRSSVECKTKYEAHLSNNANQAMEIEVANARRLVDSNKQRVTRSQIVANANNVGVDTYYEPDSRGLILANDEKMDDGDDDFTGLPDESEESPSDDDDRSENSEAEGEESGGGVDNFNPNEDQPIPNEDLPVPSSRGLDAFKAYVEDNSFFAPLTRAEECGIKLMEAMRRKLAPMNAYDVLMEWHLREKKVITEEQRLRDAGSRHFVGRSTLMKRLAHRYNLHNKQPVIRTVRLPSSKEIVKIPVFDAEDCIVQLLTNPKLEDSDFDFFNDDPLAAPPKDLDYIGNINTGSAYIETHKKLITGPNQQLVGVMFYIDGASTGHFADLPVTAVKLSLTIFSSEARTKEHMWAILGYLPQAKVAESRGKRIFLDSKHMEADNIELQAGEGEDVDINDSDDDDGLTEIKAQDFHYMLSVILDSYVKGINRTGMLWELMYKNKVYPIHFKFFVPLVRCDTEEADTLCGKYKSRTKNVAHICRQCHVPTLKCSDHRANYKPKTQGDIEKLIRKGKLDRLKEISQHYLRNAWYTCRFRLDNDRGIHGACPMDLLHSIQLGIFKYTRDIFFEFIGDSAEVAYEINGLSKQFGSLLAHQSERDLPTTNFSKGIKEGKLMARDYRGVLLTMDAILMSTDGKRLLKSKRKFKKDTGQADWVLLVELLLEWEAYLCLPRMKRKHVARLDKKHRYIMYIMRKVAKRSKGMGLNIMKFHGIVHLMEDILAYGVPTEHNTAANESHHKLAKYAAQLTQRNESNFEEQVALRQWEFRVIDMALEEIFEGLRPSDYYFVDSQSTGGMSISTASENSNKSDKSQPESKVITDDARISVFWDEETVANGFEMHSRGRHAHKTAMPNDLLDFLVDLQSETVDHLPHGELPIYTRHRRGDVIFHAHPNFQGKGPWKDWAVIDWGGGYGQLPCHLQAFVVLEGMPSGVNRLEFGGIVLKDGVYAVVEEAKMEEKNLGRSDLLVPFLKTVEGVVDGKVTGRIFYLADTEAIVKPCAMIPDIGGPPNRYFMVKPRSLWHKEFIAWVERPHHEDQMSDEEMEDE